VTNLLALAERLISAALFERCEGQASMDVKKVWALYSCLASTDSPRLA